MSTSSAQSTGSTPEGSRGSLDEHFAYVENMTARRVAVGAVVAKATYVHVLPKKDGDAAAKGQGVSMVAMLELCDTTDSTIGGRFFQGSGRCCGLGFRGPGLLEPFKTCIAFSRGQPSADLVPPEIVNSPPFRNIIPVLLDEYVTTQV